MSLGTWLGPDNPMSAVTELALPRVLAAEGFRPNPYTDTVGVLTIGYGTALSNWTQERAKAHCEVDLQFAEADLDGYDWYVACDDIRKSVLLDMVYNLGLGHLLGFAKFLDALRRQDWQAAHDEMLDSLWARQVGQRAQNLARIMLTGMP